MSAKEKDVVAEDAVEKPTRKRKHKSYESAVGSAVLSDGVRAVVMVETRKNSASQLVKVLLSGKASDDRMELYRAVKTGFPLQSVLNMIEISETYKRHGVLSKIVGASDRTLARRLKTPDEALTPEQSTRALNYAEMLEKATQVLGSRELAEQWMVKPARGLDGEVPIDLIANSVGYELVSDFLTRIEYGVY
ncbi:hypothetical protein D3C84_683010 [compost metagenome]|uniref:type II RES/Xre toxin-antitoxin system antitoxin n=1 Tax=Pseudomonas sp. TNT2022 ID1044 TaxID=2942636 RepID=UPI000F902821|nr:antitoxin Xre/MbcA/ParS toxin-binding domain-containing protein [Pseudomonas sp. TNT2022 ID1044]MDD0999169.1 DUF2384 domain-containing protein [Pseudomonas sp. TNT2022 ID1044]